jgi:hypothetical protein
MGDIFNQEDSENQISVRMKNTTQKINATLNRFNKRLAEFFSSSFNCICHAV